MGLDWNRHDELIKKIRNMHIVNPDPAVLRAPDKIIEALPNRASRAHLSQWLSKATQSRKARVNEQIKRFYGVLTGMQRGSVIHAESFIQSEFDTSPRTLATLFRDNSGLLVVRKFSELDFSRNDARSLAPFQKGISKNKGLWVIL